MEHTLHGVRRPAVCNWARESWEYRVPESERVQGGVGVEPVPGALTQEVLSQWDFNAQEHGVG